MVAREQHLGHVHAPEARGPRVLGVLEQPGGREGLVDRAHLVAERSGQKAADRVDHDERGELPARQDVVAEGEDLVGERVGPLVHPLVATADEQQPLHAGEALGDALVEAASAGREEHDVWPRPGAGDVLDRLEDGLGLHEHALAAPERGVVDRAVTVVGPVAQVVGAKVEHARAARPPEDRDAQVGLEDLGKDGERLTEHLWPP